jgi:class 3 adenylate cyclase
MSCDLVGSTTLSEQLDPEEYREVVHGYQQISATVIERFGGHMAQYLGDGLLVYFGYPVAHEDDAARAVRAGLEIITAISQVVPSPFQAAADKILPVPPLSKEGTQMPPLEKPVLPAPVPRAQVSPVEGGATRSAGGFGSVEGRRELQVRIGIHTGPVVVGEMGGGAKRELLALGETPNLAARIQGQAAPNEVVISTATYRLVEGLFECEDRGQPELKGVSTPLSLYQVQGEGEAQTRFDVAVQRGLMPLVGREEELELLRRRWERATTGQGQVVLLSGEAGIGKSRLVQALKEQVIQEGATRVEFRCSPYHQNTALYPITEHLQRLLQFERDEAAETKLAKLDHLLSQYRFPHAETVPLLAALFSLPPPAGVAPLSYSPQKRK